MTIRTISQLNSLQSLTQDDLIEVSHQNGTDGDQKKYTSNNVSYGKLSEQLSEEIIDDVKNQFKLENQNVEGLSTIVDNILNSNTQFSGTKTFKDTPEITVTQDAQSILGTNIPNVACVKDIITQKNIYINQFSIVDANPHNDSGITEDSERFIHWHFDNGTRSTSQFVWPDGSTHESETCNNNGNLVIYGWLADNGNVLPQEAWVAIYGKIMYPNENGQQEQAWVVLQVQPWIIGSKSSAMQYVSFNIPVKTGLELKIKTGFNVNTNPSGLQFGNRETFSLNEPGSFIGYIIHNDN